MKDHYCFKGAKRLQGDPTVLYGKWHIATTKWGVMYIHMFHGIFIFRHLLYYSQDQEKAWLEVAQYKQVIITVLCDTECHL